ncbi:GtrA family protein [Zwartia sp.]|uniref:GtrA family protein n=1 Tax=Zwartia sp. TaxID=2978004 RepID=UPI003BAED308
MPNSHPSYTLTARLNSQLTRYIINGLVATVIHFLVLTFNLKVLEWNSAGVANFIAAIFGISVSFIGSRYYVFNGSLEPLVKQLYRFMILYAAIAILHGLLMYVWVDLYLQNYMIGFVIATAMQVACSYIGNKVLVFKV